MLHFLLLLPGIFILLPSGCCSLQCAQPQVPENGHVIFPTAGPLEPGTRIKYKCDVGFVHLGLETRRCDSQGHWTGRPPLCAVNVGLYKPAYQSSSLVEDSVVLHANLSTDGQLEGACSGTVEGPGRAWWEVDLLAPYAIYAVEVLLSPSERLANLLEIRVSGEREDDNGTLCYKHEGSLEADRLHTFVCHSDDLVGRYVRITTRRSLRLCEVFVLSVSAPSPWQCGSLPNMESWGVHNGRCFHGSRDALPWFSASTHCRLSGASLVSRIQWTDQEYLATNLRRRAPKDAQFYWIGLGKGEDEPRWSWVEGKQLGPSDSTFWEDGDRTRTPSSASRASYGATMARNFFWRWIPALQPLWYHWICESKPLFCASPGVPSDGGVMLSSQAYSIGTKAYYYCNYGFLLQGLESRTCIQNGTWTGTPPLCSSVDCGTPPILPNGFVSLLNGTTGYGTVTEYRCSEGFHLIGPKTRECTADGTWAGSLPQCQERECEELSGISNGSVSVDGTRVGAIAEFRCREGFHLVGSKTMTCTEGGTWEPEALPNCYDSNSLRNAFVDESDGSREWKHQTNLMTGFIVAVVILLIAIFLILFWIWKKKKLYDTFSMSTLYATPTIQNPHLSEPKDVLYAYAKPNGMSIPSEDQGIYSISTDPSLAAQSHSASTSDSGENSASQTPTYMAPPPKTLFYSQSSSQVPQTISAANMFVPETTHLEVPPELLRMQQLPNGNIHLTLPCIRAGQNHGPFRPPIPFPPPRTNRRPQLPSVPPAPRFPLPTDERPRAAPPRRRKKRDKKFHTMVGFVRKKITETTTAAQSVFTLGNATEEPPPSRWGGERPKVSLPISNSDPDLRRIAEAARTASPTPTEILFSFDDDEPMPDDGEDSGPDPIYDCPPVLRHEHPEEANIYEEVPGSSGRHGTQQQQPHEASFENSGFELVNTYC